jgi:beta-barrel assembly-enhancing protease
MNTIPAWYYDGKTARRQSVTLYADGDQLVFTDNDGQEHRWGSLLIQRERKKGWLELRLKSNPAAYLAINGEQNLALFDAQMGMRMHKGLYERLLEANVRTWATLAVVFLGLCVASYFYVLPVLAESAALLIPKSFDEEIGSSVMDEIYETEVVNDSLTELLNDFAATLELQHPSLEFHVVESDEFNAFALPSGDIVVYDKLLKKMETPEQLAALLGHEAAHVTHRHGIRSLTRSLAGYLFVSAVFSDASGVMAILADNANTLQSLSYSRAFESQADDESLRILEKNKLSAKGMEELFALFEKEEKVSLPAILSSHPMSKSRKEKAIKKRKTEKTNLTPAAATELKFRMLLAALDS